MRTVRSRQSASFRAVKFETKMIGRLSDEERWNELTYEQRSTILARFVSEDEVPALAHWAWRKFKHRAHAEILRAMNSN